MPNPWTDTKVNIDGSKVLPPERLPFLAEHAGRAVDPATNGAGVPLTKLSNKYTGAAMHADSRKLGSKRPSAIAVAFSKAGLDWRTDFAEAIKANKRERIKLWLRLLPYLVTNTSNKLKVKRWKGKASKAALIALESLERE